jgi:hypothetical protein
MAEGMMIPDEEFVNLKCGRLEAGRLLTERLKLRLLSVLVHLPDNDERNQSFP